MLFYVYVTEQSRVLKIYGDVTQNKKIYMYLNRNKIKPIGTDKSECLKKSKDGCKFKIDKVKSGNKMLISILNGWNKIRVVNVLWNIL